MKDNIYSLINKNPEFDYYLYSDEESAKYIEENYPDDVLSAFNTLKPGAFKSDLWRYCILYLKGGVYLDIKFTTIEPLKTTIARTPTVFVKDIWPYEPYECFYNGVMISPPNNSVFKECIAEIVDSCKMKLYKTNVLDVTGPCLLGRKLKDVNSYIWNNTKYTYGRDELDGIIVDYIMYNDRRIMQSYVEYRIEQRLYQKTEKYGDMWHSKNIYDEQLQWIGV